MDRPFLALMGVVAVSGWLGCSGDESDSKPKSQPAANDPGRVTLHRLNRAEYNNTVRDLLGTGLSPANDFPADDHSYGFDNIADTLTISPTQLELYARAADLLAEEALTRPSTSETQLFEGEELIGSTGDVSGQAYNLWSNGELPVTVTFPADGTYAIGAVVWGDQAGPDPVEMTLSVGGVALGQWDITQTSASPVLIEQETMVTAGTKVVSVDFLNDYYDSVLMLDRNLYVDWIRVVGPLDAPAANPIRDRLVTCDLDAVGKPCAREVLTAFTPKAWRRPVTDAEIDALMAFVDLAESQKDTVEAGLKTAISAVLLSPHFLFRVELDPDPTSLTPHLLTGFELASRLSYFLWSSMPDDELFAAAEDGTLDTSDGIRAQVTRMLADPRSDALVDNFTGQWLYTRALVDHQPDYIVYPTFDEPLRAAMRLETDLFARELIHGDRDLNELVTGDFTFINDTLAKHYGMPSPGGSDMIQVSLESSAQRRGLLTQASLLTVTSYPRRTSPVKRGKWILTQLLCSEPSPPPPGVEGLPDEDIPTGSVRERLEAHRADPLCASCHAAMDPLGFGLEHFDGIGAFRDSDQGFAVDATGELPTGETFDGARAMADLIAGDKRLGACVADKVFTYGLGRAPTFADRPYLDAALTQVDAGGHRIKDVIAAIATSDPFRMRRGESEGSK